MAISGVKIKKDIKGRPLTVTFTVKKMHEYKHIIDIAEILEDLSDHITVQQRKGESTVSWESVKKELDKKHGFKK